MNSPDGLVIGTAGHIDHGKTSLIRALTGMDTDRLAEEKRRGISIDLGFAHLRLENGCRVSFIDVPGHERFIKNMLAGVAGIQAVLLIVAADEGIKPQTREHFDICRLLGIPRGIIVLTKTDAATPEQIAAARAGAVALCAGSFLQNAPLIAVSAATGEGLADLKLAISVLAQRAARATDSGLVRLPIDRSFALKGFGTIVTGTLWSGALRVGDTVMIHPIGREARIRGLQLHGAPVDTARAGQRAAVNLSGVDSSDIRRGCVLTGREGLAPTDCVDVALDWLSGFDGPEARGEFLFHAGTAETTAALKLLSSSNDHAGQFARVRLSERVIALPGDRFVLRRPSPARTVAGGTIIDPFPPARRNRAATLNRLRSLSNADPARRIALLVEEKPAGCRLPELVRHTGLPAQTVLSLSAANSGLVFAAPAQRLLAKSWIERKRGEVRNWLRDFHARNPALPGAPFALARLDIEPALTPLVFDGFPGLRVEKDIVALDSHQPETNPSDIRALSRIEQIFRQAGFQPPPPSQVLRSEIADQKKARGLLEALIKSQKLVRISEDLIFHADVLSHVRKSLSAHKGRRFSVPEFKDWTQISRKYAIPLLEYLDRQHVTRREGDFRVVL